MGTLGTDRPPVGTFLGIQSSPWDPRPVRPESWAAADESQEKPRRSFPRNHRTPIVEGFAEWRTARGFLGTREALGDPGYEYLSAHLFHGFLTCRAARVSLFEGMGPRRWIHGEAKAEEGSIPRSRSCDDEAAGAREGDRSPGDETPGAPEGNAAGRPVDDPMSRVGSRQTSGPPSGGPLLLFLEAVRSCWFRSLHHRSGGLVGHGPSKDRERPYCGLAAAHASARAGRSMRETGHGLIRMRPKSGLGPTPSMRLVAASFEGRTSILSLRAAVTRPRRGRPATSRTHGPDHRPGRRPRRAHGSPLHPPWPRCSPRSAGSPEKRASPSPPSVRPSGS